MANDSRRKDTPPPTETTRLVQRTTVALAQPDLGLVAGVPPLAILPQPVDLLRTDDLLFLRCSFVNLTWNASQAGAPPSLVRNTKNRPAFLVVTLPPQHVIERAFFQTAAGALPGATNPPGKPDPDAGRGGGPLEVPPVFASLAARSRLVFKVTDQQIVYTVEGILQAMARPRRRSPSGPGATSSAAGSSTWRPSPAPLRRPGGSGRRPSLRTTWPPMRSPSPGSTARR